MFSQSSVSGGRTRLGKGEAYEAIPLQSQCREQEWMQHTCVLLPRGGTAAAQVMCRGLKTFRSRSGRGNQHDLATSRSCHL